MLTSPETLEKMQQHSGTSKKTVKLISSVLGSWAGRSDAKKSSAFSDSMQKQGAVVLVLVNVLVLVLVLVVVVVVCGA